MTVASKFGVPVLAAALALLIGGAAQAQSNLPTLKITVFSPPSQSIWIPTLIRELEIDKKHGFRLEITPKPSRIAYTDFASGADPVCYCAAIAAVARFKQQGADITLLWNIFNYDAFIVTNNPSVKTPKDIEGRSLQVDTITGSWVLSNWFLQAHGVNLSKVQVQSVPARGAASLAELSLKRIDGVLLNPTEASVAILESPEPLRAVGLFDLDLWKKNTGTDAVPAIAIGVWRSWLAKPENRDLARRFYAANLEAQAYIRANPKDAARRIAGPSQIPESALLDTFTRFEHLINVRPIADYKPTIALITQKLLPEAKQLPEPLTQAELDDFVSDFKP